jgi:hypothetical protein
VNIQLKPKFICQFYRIKFVSAPVHPHVLIIVKAHENIVEHILATLQMTGERETIFKL